VARLAPMAKVPREQRDVFPRPPIQNAGKPLDYFSGFAVNEVMKAILEGQKTVLLTMATGTGKTDVRFKSAGKCDAGLNRTDEHASPHPASCLTVLSCG